MRRRSKSRRAIYGIVGAIMAVTAIGSVAAKESKPYKAPELRLLQGTENYDLMDGITYNKGKYELTVEDTGDFDIDVLGKYDVEYSLTPIEIDNKMTGDSAAGGLDEDLGVSKPEAKDDKIQETDSTIGQPEKEESKSEEIKSDINKDLSSDTGNVGQNPSDTGKDGDTGTEDSNTDSTENADSSEKEDSSKKDADNNDSVNGNESSKDDNTGSDQNDFDQSDLDNESEVGDTVQDSSNVDNKDLSEEKISANSFQTAFYALADKMTGRVYAAENGKTESGMLDEAEEGSLDETDGIIYFTRVVRVVSSLDGANIEYDEANLQIPSDAKLYELIVEKDVDFSKATPSNVETDDAIITEETDRILKATSSEAFWDEETDDDLENEDEYDGITENGVEYSLVLKDADLILKDTFLADADGKKVKKAKISVKDDTELKDAVEVKINEKGDPEIKGLIPGFYTVELTAKDPDTEEEITCEREIEIVASERVIFDAPVLYVGTKNTSYDLTAGMLATDEQGNEVTPIYIVNEEELLAAREEVQVKATPSNAVKEENESEEDETTTETRLKKGVYHVILGAKHPVSGKEFTAEREVQVVDGYYIYAPVLEVQAGSTDYDLLSGVTLKNANTGENRTDVEIRVEDASALFQSSSQNQVENDEEAHEHSTDVAESDEIEEGEHEEEAFNSAMVSFDMEQLEGTETVNEVPEDEQISRGTSNGSADRWPALQEGKYTVMLSAVDPETGEKVVTVRDIQARALSSGHFYITPHQGASGYAMCINDIYWDRQSALETIWCPSNAGGVHGSVQHAKKKRSEGTLAFYTGFYGEGYGSVVNGSGYRCDYYDPVVVNIIHGNWSNLGTGRGIDANDPDVKIDILDSYGARIENVNLYEFDKTIVGSEYNGSKKDYMFYGVSRNSSMEIDFKNFALSNYKIDGIWNTTKTGGKTLRLANMNVALSNVAITDQTTWMSDGGTNDAIFKIDGSGGDIWLKKWYVNANIASTIQLVNMNKLVITAPSNNNVPFCTSKSVKNIEFRGEGKNFNKAFRVDSPTDSVKIDMNGGNISFFVMGKNWDLPNKGTVKDNLTNKCIKYLTFKSPANVYLSNTPAAELDYIQTEIFAENVYLENGDVNIAKSDGSKDAYGNRIACGTEMPAIYIDDSFTSNGYKIGAMVTLGGTNDANPLNKETFAGSGTGIVMDPTDYKVQKNWSDSKNWRMFNGASSNKQILFYEVPSGFKPITVTHNGRTIEYSSYMMAFNAIDNQGEGSYIIINKVPLDFTKEDRDALRDMKNGSGKTLVFQGGPENTESYGKAMVGNTYHVRLREAVLEAPKGANVTFEKITLKYAEGNQSSAHGGDEITFVANGDILTFGQDVQFLSGDSNQTGYAIVFGGSDNTTCTSDVKIDMQSGTFKSVYGGSRGTNGGHSGAATITIDGKASVVDTVSGGSEYETSKAKDKDATGTEKKSDITIRNGLSPKNIYNYDKLTIAGTGNDNTVNVMENLNSEKAAGYDGVTILNGGSGLGLSGCGTSNVRQMGSLKLADDATQNAKLYFEKTTGTSSDRSNTNLVVLTKEDPLKSNHTKHRIEVAYIMQNPNGVPEPSDIVFYLKGVPDDETSKLAQVSTEHLLDGFVNAAGEHKDSQGRNIAMRAKPEEKTIILVNASVGLSVGDESAVTPYITLKEALEAITENEKSGSSNYRITFFTNYVIGADDFKAMQEMSKTTAREIKWTSKVDVTGNELNVNNVVSVPGTLSFFGTKTILDGITLDYAADQNMYANGIPMEVNSNVYMTGDGKVTLYGGSNTKKVSSTKLTVNGGTFSKIYGGGNGYGTDTTEVTITSDVGNTSVYGGSNNATTGSTKVDITVPNTADKNSFSFTSVSGFGTDENGTLVSNVTGNAEVSLKQTQANVSCTTSIENLTGFTTLNLGDVNGAFDKQHIEVTGKFDSKVTDAVEGRTDTVNLNAATLITAGGSGHIGSLVSAGGSCLTVKKGGTTYPLLVDGNVTKSDDNRIKLKVKDESTQLGDIMVTYTAGTNADETLYVDGGDYNLRVVKGTHAGDTTKMDILFANPYAHTVEGAVEYDTTGNVDEAGKMVSKFLTFKYSAENPDHVLRGYVIAMPESKVGAADSKKYTDMNTSFVNSGTYDGGADYPIYEIEWNKSTADTSATGRTRTVVPITANTWYIAHIVCEENHHTYSFLVDVTAPRQVTGKDVSINYDTASETYRISASFMDPTVEHVTQHPLPDGQTGTNGKLSYNSHGLVQYAWTLGNDSGNTTADQEAKKAVMTVDTTKVGIREVENESVQGSDTGTYTFSVSKADLKAALAADNTQNVIWVYAKDSVNNTVRLAVPMKDQMIDVTVPLKVNLVAIKKNAADADASTPKLLTPICYVKNNGISKVQVAVSGFTKKDIAGKTEDSSGLTLVEKEKDAKDFTSTEIALFVKKDALLTNVKKLAEEEDPVTGHGPMKLGDVEGDQFLDFTFDAGYNPIEIVETTNWLTNEMSYHISIAKDAASQP